MERKKRHRSKAMHQKKIALEHVREYLKQADVVFHENKARANRYVAMARKVAMKFKLKLPSALKKRFCKNCYHFLKPGENVRIRLTKQKMVYYCLDCKHFMRFPYKGRRKLKNAKDGK